MGIFSTTKASLPTKLWHQGRAIVIKVNHAAMTSENRPPQCERTPQPSPYYKLERLIVTLTKITNNFHTFPAIPLRTQRGFLLLRLLFADSSQKPSVFEQRQKKKVVVGHSGGRSNIQLGCTSLFFVFSINFLLHVVHGN